MKNNVNKNSVVTLQIKLTRKDHNRYQRAKGTLTGPEVINIAIETLEKRKK